MKILWLILLFIIPACAADRSEHGGTDKTSSRKAQYPGSEIHKLIKLQDKSYGENPALSERIGFQALALLEKNPDDELSAIVHNGLAKSYSVKGMTPAAEKEALRALQYAEKISNPQIQGDIFSTLGHIKTKCGRYKEALRFFNRAASLLEHPNINPGVRARDNSLMGLFYFDIADYPKALEYFRAAELLNRSIGLNLGLGYAINNIGLVFLNNNRFDDALRFFNEAAEIFRQLKLDFAITTIYLNLALTYNLKKDPGTAIIYYQKGMDIVARQGDEDRIASINAGMAEASINLKEYDKAIAFISKTMSQQSRKNTPLVYVEDLCIYASALKMKGDLAEAQKQITEAIRISTGLNSLSTLEYQYNILSDILTARNDWRGALGAFKNHLKCASENSFARQYRYIEEQKTLREVKLLENETAELDQKKKYQHLLMQKRRDIMSTVITASLLLLLALLTLMALLRMKIRRNLPLEQKIADHLSDQGRLREREQMFRDLAEHAPLGIFILQDDALKYANSFILSLAGYSEAELINCSPEGFIHPDDFKALEEYYQKRMQLPSSSGEMEFRGYNLRGDNFYLKVTGIAISYNNRPAFLGALTDITRSTLLQAELYKSRERESLHRLAGGLAHDFNNLLAVMLGYLQMALDEPGLPPATCQKIHNACNSSLRMSDLIAHLLAMSYPVHSASTSPRGVTPKPKKDGEETPRG